MFDNIGAKIKNLAKAFCWIGISLAVIAGVAVSAIDGLFVFVGLLIIAGGALLSWIGSFVLYGFGELVENSDIRTEIAVENVNLMANNENIEAEMTKEV